MDEIEVFGVGNTGDILFGYLFASSFLALFRNAQNRKYLKLSFVWDAISTYTVIDMWVGQEEQFFISTWKGLLCTAYMMPSALSELCFFRDARIKV